MKRFYYTLLFLLLIVSCQNSSQAEKEYIKNLEEKNRLLEQELQERKDKKDKKDQKNIPEETNQTSKDYFTIGSTEKEVLAIMGTPTSYLDMEPYYTKYHYGMSNVTFQKGKVSNYDNVDGNLKVKLVK